MSQSTEQNTSSNLSNLAKSLTAARIEGIPVEQLSKEHQLSIGDAYAIQEQGIKFRADHGEKIIGLKMGLTSEAKRKQMNLDSPLYGVLTDKMQINNGEEFHLEGSIHPKIEPEVAFYIAKDLRGKVTREEVLANCSAVCGALEILDSRYTQFKYFSMEDVISDNSSSSMFILGEKLTDFTALNLADLGMEMKINAQASHTGNSSAISGDPVLSVVQLCELMAARDGFIPAGQIVLAGAATPAVALTAGMKIELTVSGLAPVSVQVRGA